MEEIQEEKIRKSEGTVKVGKKKAYAAPKLTEYGSVEKLTGIKSGGTVDSNMTMSCL